MSTCQVQAHAKKSSRPQISAVHICPSNLRSTQIRTVQIGIAQVSTPQVSATQICTAKVRANKTSSPQTRTLQITPTKISLKEIFRTQVPTSQAQDYLWMPLTVEIPAIYITLKQSQVVHVEYTN
ncbi:MAG: hypothetical protein AAFQ40_11620 [Cyanobacteria bacterium J06623_5]